MFDSNIADWREVKVVDVVERHFCGPSPDCEERPVFDSGEWGVLKTTAITWAGWNQDAHKVLPRSYWGREEIEVKTGDVLITKAGPRNRVGVVVYVPSTRRQLVVSGKMIGLRPSLDAVLPQVLSALLALSGPQKYIHDRTTGMAESQVNFANEVLLNTPLRIPPIAEQNEIARIGVALDTAIRQTEAIVDKLNQVKQGLLHDLLTHGIDANGELRPPQSEAPHLYKESALGWIPRQWEARTFSELADFANGNSFDAGMWTDYGLPIIRIQNLNGSREFNHYAGPINSKWHILPGDLLFAWSGQKGVSFGPRIWNGPEGVLNQHIFKVLARSALVNRSYLFEVLRFRQGAIEDTAHGFKESFLHVKRGELGGVYAGVPVVSEQAAIVSKIKALEHRISKECAYLKKNKLVKFGLMDDLLTGRVRVASLLGTAP